MSVLVRKLEKSDEARWRALFADYIAFYGESVPSNVVDVTWQRLAGELDGMAGLIAVDKTGKAVGIANLVFHRSTWSPTNYCYLEDLFVDQAARGSGAGRALIDATYAFADERGATRTYWATQENNHTARKLYDRAGELTPFVQYRR